MGQEFKTLSTCDYGSIFLWLTAFHGLKTSISWLNIKFIRAEKIIALSHSTFIIFCRVTIHFTRQWGHFIKILKSVKKNTGFPLRSLPVLSPAHSLKLSSQHWDLNKPVCRGRKSLEQRWKLFLSGSAGTGAPNLSSLWPVHSAQDHAVFCMNTTAGYLFGLCADRAITKQVRLKPKQWLLGTLKSIYLIGFI